MAEQGRILLRLPAITNALTQERGNTKTEGLFSITGGTGNGSITGNAGADPIPLGSGANDRIRQTVNYSAISAGAAASASSGANAILSLMPMMLRMT